MYGLLPCKCGGEAKFHLGFTPIYFGMCTKCDERADFRISKREARDEWNRRVSDDATKAGEHD